MLVEYHTGPTSTPKGAGTWKAGGMVNSEPGSPNIAAGTRAVEHCTTFSRNVWERTVDVEDTPWIEPNTDLVRNVTSNRRTQLVDRQGYIPDIHIGSLEATWVRSGRHRDRGCRT